MITGTILLVLVVVIGCSIWFRIKCLRSSQPGIETKSSLLSLAIEEMVSVAGGVYLSLILLVSFLKLDIPEKVVLCGTYIDPLALISLILAIIQPVFRQIMLKLSVKFSGW